jgi:hypothetical protein
MRTIILSFLLAILNLSCANTVESPSTNSIPFQTVSEGHPPNSEQQGNAFAISTAAFYQASLYSSNSPGQVISLTLTPEHKAKMTTNFLDTQRMVTDTGSWTTLASGNLMLHLKCEGDPQIAMLEFETSGEKLVYRGSEFGTGGLTFWVKPLPQEQ